MFKKLILSTAAIPFILVLVSCTPNIPDISESIEKINRMDEKIDQMDKEIENMETELND